AVAAKPGLRGVVLMKHGLVTWGRDSRESYDTHLELVTKAEAYAAAAATGRRVFGAPRRPALPPDERRDVAAAIAPAIRGALSAERGTILRFADSEHVHAFIESEPAPAL